MSLFSVDPDKCKRDGICVAVCPASLVREGEDGMPVPLAGREQHCIACGHCVSACPTGALSHSLIPERGLIPINRDLGLSPEQLRQFFMSRRSIRVYKDKDLPRETIAGLIEIASHAPSGHNAQPVEWIVLDGRAKVEALLEVVVEWMRSEVEAKTELARMLNLAGAVRAYGKGKDVICRGAPHVVCAHVPTDSGITPLYDGIIALAHLDLAANGMGLGTCWAGYLGFAAADKGVRDFLGLPGNREPAYFMLLGEPRYRYRLMPPRKDPAIDWI